MNVVDIIFGTIMIASSYFFITGVIDYFMAKKMIPNDEGIRFSKSIIKKKIYSKSKLSHKNLYY